MSRTSDFSAVAARYDATRHIPEAVLLRGYGRLVDRGVLPPRGRVLDAGCGTGQVSLPLARLGYAVVGIDVSDAMVRIATAKARPGWDARYAVGDARAIDHPADAFDVTVFSKLLMHVEDWRGACREFVRVTRPGGAVVQISDRGFFGSAVRRAFAQRADALGHVNRFPGTQPSSPAVPAAMAELGCSVSTLEPGDLRWEHRVTAREVLDGFRERLFAEYWPLPHATYEAILAEVGAWAAARPGGLDVVETLRPFLSIEIYRVADRASNDPSTAA